VTPLITHVEIRTSSLILFHSFVQVISGQRFPKPKGSGAKGDTIDPYVTVEIFGIPADCAEERTKTVQHNGRWQHWAVMFILSTFKITNKLQCFKCDVSRESH